MNKFEFINVNVKLYSGLGKCVKGYDTEAGIALRLPAGSSVGDLINAFELPAHGARFVAIGGKIRQLNDELADGDDIKVFDLSDGG